MAGVGFDDVLWLRNLFIEGLECAEIACLHCSRLRDDPPEQSRPMLRQLTERVDRVRRYLASESLVLEFVLCAASEHVRPGYLSNLELPPMVVDRNPSLLSRTGHGVAAVLMDVTVKCVRALLEGEGGAITSEASFAKLEKALGAAIPEVERESRLAVRLLMTNPGAAEAFSGITTLYPRRRAGDGAGGLPGEALPADEEDARFCLDALRFRRESGRGMKAFIRARAERNVKAGEARDVDAEYERLKKADRRFRLSLRRLGEFLSGGTTGGDFAETDGDEEE